MCLNCLYLKDIQVIQLNISSKYKLFLWKDETVSLLPIHISVTHSYDHYLIFAPHPKKNIPIQLQSNWELY